MPRQEADTDRHYLHQELLQQIQKSPSFLTFLQQSSLDGLWYWDLEQPDQEWMSPDFWTTLGYDPTEKPHSPAAWQDLIHPEDKAEALRQFEAHCQDPRVPYDLNVRYRHADGSTVWIRCRGMALRDATGKAIRMLGAHTNITPLKTAELSLQSRDELWNQAIENSGVGIWSWNLEQNQVTYEKEWLRMFSPDPRSTPPLISAFFARVHPEDLELCQRQLKNLKNGHQSQWIGECRMHGANGQDIWTQLQLKTGKRDAESHPLQIIATQIDISQSKRIELAQEETLQSLQQQTLLLSASNEISNTGWWTVDLNTHQVFWSDITRQIHEVEDDFEPDLACGINFYKAGENRDRLQADLEQAIHNGTTLSGEYELITAKGRSIWVQSLGKAEYDKQGEVVRLVGCFRDITARKAQELALQNMLQEMKRQTALLKTSSELARMGWWRFDLKTGAVEWSEVTYQIFEIDPETPLTVEYIRQFYKDSITAEYVRRTYDRAMENHDDFDITYEIKTHQGHEKWIRLVGQVEFGAHGEAVKVFGALQDITEQKRTEQNLIEAKQKAEAANEAKDNFLANMSHEMRTPLNGISGFIELLMRTSLNGLQQSYIQAASYSTRALTSSINSILDFSKLEQGELKIQEEKILLAGWVQHLTETVQLYAQEKDLRFQLTLSEDLPGYIWADPMRLAQIVNQLLDNAIKFTERGEIELKIQCLPGREQGQEQLHIAVRDTGSGIAPDYQQHIFDSFSQLDASSTRKFGGLGLGLSLAKRMLELMQSELRFKSTLHQGSLFWFDLPVQTEGRYHHESPPALTHLKRILIIDDHIDNRQILHDMLALDNIQADTASNGFEGLQMLLKNEYDFAIIDYHMPLMDGLEVIQKIRQGMNLNAFELPILLLHSVDTNDRIHNACQEFKINFHETKPITLDRLRHILSIEVPLICPEEHEKAQLPRAIPAAEKAFNILVVDDNHVNLILAENLVKAVYPAATIVTATNGKEAIQAVQHSPFDLILMDIQMPTQNGYDATQHIRKMGKTMPIIALTAGTQIGERERCLAAGMNDYLSKPVMFDHFKAVILQHIPIAKAAQNLPHINHQMLQERIADLDLDLAQIQHEVCQNLDLQIESLHESLQARDIFRIRTCAQRIRGTALYLCFERIAGLAEALERVSESEIEQAKTLYEALQLALHAVRELNLV